MAFEIGWLESARRELDAEIEYVYSEFGEDSARRARTKISRERGTGTCPSIHFQQVA